MDRKNLHIVSQMVAIVAVASTYNIPTILNGLAIAAIQTNLLLLIAGSSFSIFSKATMPIQSSSSPNLSAFQQFITMNSLNNNIANKEVVNICL